MQGTSYFAAWNCKSLLKGSGALRVRQIIPTEATLTGSGMLYAGVTVAFGRGYLVPLTSLAYGSDVTNVGWAYGELRALQSTSYASAFVPADPDMGYGNLPPLSLAAIGRDIDKGQGSATLPALIAQAGEITDAAVGHGGTYNQLTAPLTSIGIWGTAGECYLHSSMAGLTPLTATRDIIIVLTSTGTVESVLSMARTMATEFISSSSASGILSVLGVFGVSFLESLYGDDFIISYNSSTEAGALDASSQVWVVNLETGASSQYEGFGFNSFLERDGEYYGLADDGIYQITGEEDEGLPIASYIDFGETHCGVPGRKKILNIHVGTSEGGQSYMRVKTAVGKTEKTETYRLEETQRGPTGWRAKVPPHRQGEFWNFELLSEDAFELTNVEFHPAKLSRRQ